MPNSRLNLTDGDVVACFGADWISRGISLETSSLFAPKRLRWAPSHVAIICSKSDGECPAWFESTEYKSRECLIRRYCVSGAQCHWPVDRINDYTAAGGRVDVYRLTDFDELDFQERLQLRDMLCRAVRLAMGYDLTGAFMSASTLKHIFGPFRSGRLDDVFCSELIAGILQRINRMNRANPAGFYPAKLLRTLVKQGTYGYSHSYTEPITDDDDDGPILLSAIRAAA